MQTLKIKNNQYLIELFLIYQYKNHLLAHLYEHLIYRQLINLHDIKIEECDIGSGLINVKFKCHKKYINLDFIKQILNLDTINKNNFVLEKKRLSTEITKEINNQTKVFYEAIQYKIFSYKKILEKNKNISDFKLESIKKFVKNIKSENIIVIFAGPNFNDNRQLKFKIPNTLLEQKKYKLPKLNLLKQKNCNYNEINFGLPINNNFEAHLASISINLINKQLESLSDQLDIYQIKNHLYKDYNKYIYYGFSFLCRYKQKEKLIEIIKKITITKKDFLTEKKNLIKILNNIQNKKLHTAIDYIWQKLEWNNYIEPQREIKKIKLLTSKKLTNWINKKIKSSEIIKF